MTPERLAEIKHNLEHAGRTHYRDVSDLLADTAALRAYVGDNLLKSDFKTADDMRATITALREAVRVLSKGIDAADLMASQTTSDGSAYPTIGEYIPEYAQARSEIDANQLAAAAVREAKEQA